LIPAPPAGKADTDTLFRGTIALNRRLHAPISTFALGANVAASAEHLLRELLECLDSTPDPHPSETSGGVQNHGVVLDRQVDGVVVKLVRAETSDAQQRQILRPREQEIVSLVAKGPSARRLATCSI
jgi:hypothetical protein